VLFRSLPLEAGLAIERGVPCFLLGGLSGAARDYVRDHPEVIRALKNGLNDTTNQSLATEENVGGIVVFICDQLSRLPLVCGRVSDGISFRILTTPYRKDHHFNIRFVSQSGCITTHTENPSKFPFA